MNGYMYGPAMKRLDSHISPATDALGNGSDRGVGLGVGCDGQTLWLVVGSLSERRERGFFLFFLSPRPLNRELLVL